ncbi:MAG TPA: CHAT domain-containing protein [Solirubrobacteraceae bacterium]|nr:CHAT domain-containing protein [Solirubrobacteraceae bacterium]
MELRQEGGNGDWADPSARATIAADLDAGSAPDAIGGGADLAEAARTYVRSNERSAAFTALGDWLGGLVLRDDVADEWERLIDANDGVRTLLDVRAKPLSLLPWELMRRDGRLLFTKSENPFARAERLRSDDTQELVPMRVVVVEGTRDDELGTRDEIDGIRAAVPAFAGRIDITVLSEPSSQELRDELERVRPHILHFAGHGMKAPGTNEPALRIGDWLLKRDDIDTVLPVLPRVAVLNACRSGESDVDDVRALAQTFLANGSAAVVGMQGDVRGEAAACFGQSLYGALAKGKLIDEAVADARAEVYTLTGSQRQARDWFLPSLTLRVRPEQVLPVHCFADLTDNEIEHIEQHLYAGVRFFVDRAQERWDLVKAADPEDGRPKRLVLVHGNQQIGKTALANWIRTRCALRGRRVRYVDLDQGATIGFVEALEIIRDTAEDVPSLCDCADTAFARFNYDLGHLLAGRLPPEPDGPLPAEPPEIPAAIELGEGLTERLFLSFRDALIKTAEAEPLVLILDHVGKILPADFQQRIYPMLLKELAENGPPELRLVVVMTDEQQRMLLPADETQVWGEVRVDLIAPDQYEALAEEIVLRLGRGLNDNLRIVVSALANATQAPWPPTNLVTLRALAEQVQ